MVVFFHFAFYSGIAEEYPIGMRAAMNYNVVYPNLVPYSWWGSVGVPIFFVISGFVISISAEKQFPMHFIRSRLLRLAPTLWFFASLSLIVTIIYISQFDANLFLLWAKSLILFPKGPWIDGVYWTLVVEISFYSLILLVIYFDKYDKLEVYATIICFISLILVSINGIGRLLAADNYAYNVFHEFMGSYKSRITLLSTGSYFVVGVLFYLFYQKGYAIKRLVVFIAAVVASEIGIYIEASDLILKSRLSASPVIPCLVWSGAVITIAVTAAWKKISRRGFHWRVRTVARKLGLVTYPLYLIHFVFGAWIFGILLRGGMGRFGALAAAIVICIASSYFFAFYLEPWIRRKLGALFDRFVAAASRSLAFSRFT